MSNHFTYDVFTTESECLSALNYINSVIHVPSSGIYDGHIVPDQNLTWSIPFQRENDGKWVFFSLQNWVINEYPTELGSYYNTTYPHTQEEYHDDWGPVPN